MIDVEKIKAIANEVLEDTQLFLIDVTCNLQNEIEVVIDSDTSVDIDDCVDLSNAIEAQMNRDEEDFQLTVISAGVGYPLRVYRQYLKLLGRPVDVVLVNGTKIRATLKEATEDTITLSYIEKVVVEGKKRKVEQEVVKVYPLSEVKSTKEYLDFK